MPAPTACKCRLLDVAAADPCSYGDAVQGLRAVRAGGLWVWDHCRHAATRHDAGNAGRTPATILQTFAPRFDSPARLWDRFSLC